MEKLEDYRMHSGWPLKRKIRRTHEHFRTIEDLGYRWAGSVKMGAKTKKESSTLRKLKEFLLT